MSKSAQRTRSCIRWSYNYQAIGRHTSCCGSEPYVPAHMLEHSGGGIVEGRMRRRRRSQEEIAGDERGNTCCRPTRRHARSPPRPPCFANRNIGVVLSDANRNIGVVRSKGHDSTVVSRSRRFHRPCSTLCFRRHRPQAPASRRGRAFTRCSGP